MDTHDAPPPQSAPVQPGPTAAADLAPTTTGGSHSARLLARVGLGPSNARGSSNMVYGSLLTGAYFLAVIEGPEVVSRFVEKGLIGFLVMATCHGFANYVTTDVGLPMARRIVQFWTNESYLLAPFIITAAATLVVDYFTGADNAISIGYDFSLGIIALLTYAASRGAHRSRPRALLVAVLAAVVGIVVSALKAYL